MTEPAPLTFNAWLRWDLIHRLLDDLGPDSRVLEVGMGQGAVATRLAPRSRYTGVERDPVSRQVAEARLGGAARVLGELDDLDPTDRFDVVCAFEVLEHIEDDRAALAGWVARLRPGGRILLSVPAGPDRMGPCDHLAGHFRRYSRTGLADVMRAAGCEGTSVLTYGFPLGYPLEWFRHAVARRRLSTGDQEERTAASGRLLQPRDSLGWATRAATAPFRLAQRPFTGSELGTGLVALAWRAP